MPIGPSAAVGEVATHGRKESYEIYKDMLDHSNNVFFSICIQMLFKLKSSQQEKHINLQTFALRKIFLVSEYIIYMIYTAASVDLSLTSLNAGLVLNLRTSP